MSFRRFLFSLWLTQLPIQLALSQQNANRADVNATLRSCAVIQHSLETAGQLRPAGTPFADAEAGGVACDKLKKAVSDSDAAGIQSAITSLRPILARLGLAPTSPKEQLAALENQTAGLSGKDLFYKLPELAKRAVNAGESDKAQAYSQQLLKVAPDYPKNWNYGNAIFYGNFVLGRVAIQKGNVAQAGQYLLAASRTPGSPQLDTFGPNMTLAKELLEQGQSDLVLQYLALCRNFWKMDRGKLDEWSETIRRGGFPDFTLNLNY